MISDLNSMKIFPTKTDSREAHGVYKFLSHEKMFYNSEVENEYKEAQMLQNSVVPESSQKYSYSYMTSP